MFRVELYRTHTVWSCFIGCTKYYNLFYYELGRVLLLGGACCFISETPLSFRKYKHKKTYVIKLYCKYAVCCQIVFFFFKSSCFSCFFFFCAKYFFERREVTSVFLCVCVLHDRFLIFFFFRCICCLFFFVNYQYLRDVSVQDIV